MVSWRSFAAALPTLGFPCVRMEVQGDVLCTWKGGDIPEQSHATKYKIKQNLFDYSGPDRITLWYSLSLWCFTTLICFDLFSSHKFKHNLIISPLCTACSWRSVNNPYLQIQMSGMPLFKKKQNYFSSMSHPYPIIYWMSKCQICPL